jgi:hypothetical protein
MVLLRLQIFEFCNYNLLKLKIQNCIENSIKTKHINDLVWQDNGGKMIQKLLNHLAKICFVPYAFSCLVVACPRCDICKQKEKNE